MTSFVDPDGGDTLDYTYDAAGNEISKNNTSTSVSWTYGYNNSNQLVSVTETNTATSLTMETVSYEYDALGNLLKETVTPYTLGSPDTAVTTEFAVDGWNPAKAGGMGNSAFDTWAVMNGSGALQTRNIQRNGIDQILARVDNYSNGASDPTGLYYVLTDRLGSVRDVLNNTPDASPVAVMTYNAWGNLISTPSSYQGMYGWDGYQIDEATSLYLDHARVYDPQSQRWIEQDPMWFDAGDSNLYRYVNNAPTNATDPSGMQQVESQNYRYWEEDQKEIKIDFGGLNGKLFVNPDADFEATFKGPDGKPITSKTENGIVFDYRGTDAKKVSFVQFYASTGFVVQKSFGDFDVGPVNQKVSHPTGGDIPVQSPLGPLVFGPSAVSQWGVDSAKFGDPRYVESGASGVSGGSGKG